MRLVVGTPDLLTLQRHATDLGRERGLKARITRMQRSKAWDDLGDLKRERKLHPARDHHDRNEQALDKRPP